MDCVLTISQGNDNKHTLRVWTFHEMSNVLKAAGDQKIKEVQLCLEGIVMSFFTVLSQMLIVTTFITFLYD